METLVVLMTALALSGFVLVILGTVRVAIDARPRGGNPTTDAVFDAVREYVIAGIVLAYRTSERVIDAGQARLRSMDKRAIAISIYRALPTTVEVRGIPIPVALIKSMVSEDQFATWVDLVFEELMQRIDTTQSHAVSHSFRP